MKQGTTLFLLMFFVPWMLHAQEAPQTISLQQAVEFAIKHNKELQSSQMNIDLYRQKVRESVSQGLPQVNGTVTYSTNFNYKMDFGGQAIKMKDQSNLTVGLQQLLFSGQWILGMQTSKIAVRLTEQEVETTELDIVENIYNSYYTVLVSERMRFSFHQNGLTLTFFAKEYTDLNLFGMPIAYCRSVDTPSARMIEKGISRLGRPVNDVQAAIENVGASSSAVSRR